MNGLLEIQKETSVPVPDLIVIFDNSGKIVFCGGSSLINSAHFQAELAGKRIKDIFAESGDIDFGDSESINGKEAVLSLANANTGGNKFYCKFLPGYNSLGEGSLHILSGYLIIDKILVTDSPELIENPLDSEIEKVLMNHDNSYKNLFYNSPIGIYRTGLDGSILMANPALIKMLGYSNFEELSRRNLEDKNNFQPGYSREEFKKKIETEGSITGFESKWIRNDGSFVIIRENAKCIYGQNGEIKFYEGTVEDITARVEAETALMESEEMFRTLAEQSPNIIFIYQDNHIKYINNKCTEVIGYPKEYFTDPAFDWSKLLTEKSAENLSEKPRLNYPGFEELTILSRQGQRLDVIVTTSEITYSHSKALLGILTDISYLKAAEHALLKSEERYRNLVENINEIYYVADNTGECGYISPNIKNFTGYEAHEWIGRSVLEFVYKEDKMRVTEFYANNRENNTLDASIEFRTVKKNGTVFWIEQMTRFVRNSAGRLLEYRCVARDISKRKNSEEKINLLAHAVKNTRDAITITDLEYKIIFVNEALVEISGYKPEELIGKNIGILRSESANTELLHEIKEATGIGSWSGEVMNKKKNGEEFPAFLSTARVLDDNGKPYAFVEVMRDITESKEIELELDEYRNRLEELVVERTKKLDVLNSQLKQEIDKFIKAEESLQDQLVFLQTLIDTIPNPIFIRNAEQVYTGCNKAFEEFHGISQAELIGKNIFSSGINIDMEFIREKDEEIMYDKGQQSYEAVLTDSKGEKHDMLIYRAVFRKNDGAVGGIVGILFDITDIKKMGIELAKSLEKEMGLSNLKSRFISVASHEFRTPLTTILAAADLLEMVGREWPDEKYFHYIKNIQKAVEYMTELIDDVLTVSKVDSGSDVFRPESVNLLELTNDIINDVKLSAPSNITVHSEYLLNDRLFNLDKKLMTQALNNLLSNAVKYSPGGGNIKLIVSEADDLLSLSVIDEGIGITEEDQKLLFEPFHRGKNIGKIPGTGLGLSIVSKSVELQNGKLSITSTPGTGTQAVIRFKYSSVIGR